MNEDTTHKRLGDFALDILLNEVHILDCLLRTMLAFCVHGVCEECGE